LTLAITFIFFEAAILYHFSLRGLYEKDLVCF